VGSFLCNNGKLDGILTCLDAELAAQAVQVELMSSAFELKVDLAGKSGPDISTLFTSSVSETLGLPETDLAKLDVGAGSRRLLSGVSVRRLGAHEQGYEIGYQAVAGDDPSALAAKASGIAGGASQATFVGAMAASGVTVDPKSMKVTQAPKVFTATIVRSADGKPIAPAPPPIPTVPAPTQAPAPPPPKKATPSPPPPKAAEEEEDSNTGAIVGGIVGGLGGLAIIGGIIYLVTKNKGKGSE
jgi:hypothetical protein